MWNVTCHYHSSLSLSHHKITVLHCCLSSLYICLSTFDILIFFWTIHCHYSNIFDMLAWMSDVCHTEPLVSLISQSKHILYHLCLTAVWLQIVLVHTLSRACTCDHHQSSHDCICKQISCRLLHTCHGQSHKRACHHCMVLLSVVALGAVSLTLLGVGLVLFFAGFTSLETILPALVSIFAPLSLRGTAMGIFSSAQFLGVFTGGVLGGSALQLGGTLGLVAVLLGLTAIWLLGLWRFGRAPVAAV